MGWWIFWAIFALYWVVAVKRMPVYYKRRDERNAKEYPSLYKDDGMTKSSAAEAIGMAIFWPFYEAGRWVINYVIHTATKEQRAWDDYMKAEKIVEEYKRRKELEERAAFDKALKEE